MLGDVPELEMPEPQPFFFLEYHGTFHPSAIALSTYARDFTYAETLAYAKSIAALLRRRGVRPGDVVAVNVPDELNLFFMQALLHEAAIWCSAPRTLEDSTLELFDWMLAPALIDGFDTDRTILIDDEFMTRVAAAEHSDEPRRYDDFDSVCRISFSSGTTGVPLAIPSTVAHQARPAVGWLESRPFFSLIKGFSGSGMKAAIASVLHGDTYICPGTPEENITLAQRNYVATLQGSPAQLAEFIELFERREDRRSDIATVEFIGSFLSEALLAKVRDVLGASVTACYGSTEVGMISVRHNVTDNPADVGVPLAHVTVEIVDNDGQPVAAGAEGIVRVRTTRREPTYFRTGPHDVIRDGWFYPGDLGRLRPDGHLVLAGRASEVINAGGVKFSPDRVEGALAACEGVRDGAIIPFESPEGLSGYAAVVVCEDGFDLGTLIEPLRDACGGANPVSIFRVEHVERDDNGKVRRRELAARIHSLLAR